MEKANKKNESILVRKVIEPVPLRSMLHRQVLNYYSNSLFKDTSFDDTNNEQKKDQESENNLEQENVNNTQTNINLKRKPVDYSLYQVMAKGYERPDYQLDVINLYRKEFDKRGNLKVDPLVRTELQLKADQSPRVNNLQNLQQTTDKSPLVQRKYTAQADLQAKVDKYVQRKQENLFNEFGISAKLKVSNPNDPLEKEADQKADEIMRMPAVSNNETLYRTPSKLQNNSEASFDKSHLNSSGSGQPFMKDERSFFEDRFQSDFSHVRIHNGPDANKMASNINARAFTHGSDIYFNKGQYQPHSDSGKKLMAHELTHVVQGEGKTSLQRNTIKRLPAFTKKSKFVPNILPDIAPIAKDSYAGRNYFTVNMKKLSAMGWGYDIYIYDSNGTCVFKSDYATNVIAFSIPEHVIKKGQAGGNKNPWTMYVKINTSWFRHSHPYTSTKFHVFDTSKELYDAVSKDKEGKFKNLDKNANINLFKNSIKQVAIKRLDDNKRHLQAAANKYKKELKTDSQGLIQDNVDPQLNNTAFDRLRTMFTMDDKLKSRHDKILKKYQKAKAQWKYKYVARWSPTAQALSRSRGVSNQKLYRKMKYWEAAYVESKNARIQLHKQYPALTVLNRKRVSGKNSNIILYWHIINGFNDVINAIEDIKKRIISEDIPLSKLGPVVSEAISNLGINKTNIKTNKLGKDLTSWLDEKGTDEYLYNIVGTVLSVALGVGAFLLTVVSGGGTLPLLLAIGGAVAGFSTAYYNFERASDIWDIAKVQKSFKKNLISKEAQEQAKFNYIMGWVNLTIAGLDVVLAGVSAVSMFRSARIIRKLASAPGSKILAGLKSRQINRFQAAFKLKSVGESQKAKLIFRQLRKELKGDYLKSYSFFNKNKSRYLKGVDLSNLDDFTKKIIREADESVGKTGKKKFSFRGKTKTADLRVLEEAGITKRILKLLKKKRYKELAAQVDELKRLTKDMPIPIDKMLSDDELRMLTQISEVEWVVQKTGRRYWIRSGERTRVTFGYTKDTTDFIHTHVTDALPSLEDVAIFEDLMKMGSPVRQFKLIRKSGFKGFNISELQDLIGDNLLKWADPVMAKKYERLIWDFMKR